LRSPSRCGRVDWHWQSVYVGLGLSVVGMFAAAAGFIAPVEGALVQEAIDVAVILNALRALGGADPNDAGAGPSSNAVREDV
jgi:hypothetical protein